MLRKMSVLHTYIIAITIYICILCILFKDTTFIEIITNKMYRHYLNILLNITDRIKIKNTSIFFEIVFSKGFNVRFLSSIYMEKVNSEIHFFLLFVVFSRPQTMTNSS